MHTRAKRHHHKSHKTQKHRKLSQESVEEYLLRDENLDCLFNRISKLRAERGKSNKNARSRNAVKCLNASANAVATTEKEDAIKLPSSTTVYTKLKRFNYESDTNMNSEGEYSTITL